MSNLELYFIIENINLKILIEVEDIENKIIMYKQLINAWFLEPSMRLSLSGIKNDKMAAFVLLLTFFEPHGDCLNSIGDNGEKFKRGLDSFLEYLSNQNLGIADDLKNKLKEELWKNARCGVFHALTPRGVTIDLFNICNNIFTVHNNKFIINTYKLGSMLINYLDYFFLNINAEGKVSFEKHYNNLILKQAKLLAGKD